MEGMDLSVEALGVAVAVLTLGAFFWKVVSWHNDIVARLEASAADSKHQHDLQSEQIRSIQSELAEFKEETRRNFTKVYDRLDNLGERIARLEGKE